MNPHAKEFVPAHILKQRQEEAHRLDNLTEQLNKVDLESENQSNEDGSSTSTTARRDKTERRETTEDTNSNEKSRDGEVNAQREVKNKNQSLNHSDKDSNNHINSNNISKQTNGGGDYPNEHHDLDDEDDDRFLLNAGENICEFNGEEFIIPNE